MIGILFPRKSLISRPAGLITFSVVVRSLSGSNPLRRSKITNQPVSG
ncbi:hypothetical protein [Pseudanabaena sp. SR411]|nr:hypothetical protein [Pseudanabaena sp. SR411]